MMRFQKCFQSGKEFVMPVFAIIITKFKMPLPQRRVSLKNLKIIFKFF
jgi:hypothetical protein